MKQRTITRKRKTSAPAAGVLAFQTPAGWAFFTGPNRYDFNFIVILHERNLFLTPIRSN